MQMGDKMGIGAETLQRAYRLICNRKSISRKELAELLETSEVSAGKTIAALTNAGLLSHSKDTVMGRKTEMFSVNTERKCLLIDICRKNIAFAVTSPTDRIDSFRTISYLHLRDHDTNMAIAASDIAKFIKSQSITPDVVAIAYSTVDPNPTKDLFLYALADCGIHPSIVVLGSVAACEFCSVLCRADESFAFTQINDHIWGCISTSPDRMLDWRKIKVGDRHGESIGSIMSYDTNLDHLLVYFQRFFRTVDSVTSPDRMFMSSSFLSEKLMNKLSEVSRVENLSEQNPVMNGLLSLAKDALFEKFIFKS